MKLFSLLITITVILVFYSKVSKCCSCAPTHPEIQFCRADYAIKVLIVAKSFVQIDDNGNVISSAVNGKDIKAPPPLLSNPVSAPVDSIPLLHSLERNAPPGHNLPSSGKVIEPQHLISNVNDIQHLGEGAENDVPSFMKAEADAGDHRSDLQAYITTSSKNKKKRDGDKRRKRRRRRRQNKQKRRIQRRKRQAVFAGDFAPGQQVPASNLRVPSEAKPSSTYPSFTQYTVKILKVFKGEQMELESAFVYTPPSGGLCNMDLKLHESYLIMGATRDGRLNLNVCDFKLEMKQLNETEQRHLTNVMNHVYGKQCGECETAVCYNRENCEHNEKPYRCIWENVYTLLDYRAYQFVCVKKKQAVPPKCEWYNSLNPKSHPRDLD